MLKKFLKKKLFFNIRFKKNFSLSQIILNFTKINKNISCEEVKTLSKNLEADEGDTIYKYKKFISYIPKINVNKWIQKKLSNQKD